MTSLGTDDTLATESEPQQVAPGGVTKSLERGAQAGRYVVLRKVGAGAMGVVYAAYDPELDRTVALKLLQPDITSSNATTRLLREALALAKLSHPNAVAIYDVGTIDDDVWLAMEFVVGKTLGEWLELGRKPWREVLEVLRPAAVGLAAAHEAGLVHRDVKPDNVMLGDDGRLRVMDFGLARDYREPADLPDEDASAPHHDQSAEIRSGRQVLSESVTRVGAIVGTPAYMSPEQIRGDATDGRTDQFAFCVMLWEALYGERPFRGDSFVELANQIVEGRLHTPTGGMAVPAWLQRVVHRGLSPEVDDRWPSMDALLEGLDAGQAGARTRKVATVAVAVGLVGACALGLQHLDRKGRIDACATAGATIESVWDDAMRDRLRESLLATGAGHAAATADKLMPWLDEHAAAWRAARTDACIAHTIDKTTSEDLNDRALWCLDERRLEFDALVVELSSATTKTVSRAVRAATNLHAIQTCTDAVLLAHLPVPPDDDRGGIRDVSATLARVRALNATGAYDEGVSLAREGIDGAQAVGWPPLVASARLELGNLLQRAGEYEDAEQSQELAYFEAGDSGAHTEAFLAASGLVYTVGYRGNRHDEGIRWSKHAKLVLSRLSDQSGFFRADLLSNLALVYESRGAFETSVALNLEALALRQDALGADHLAVASSLNNLALVRHSMGEYPEAAELHRRALDVKIEALGPEHPNVATSLGNLANVRKAQGEYDEAVRLYERATQIFEATVGPDHPDLATALHNFGGLLGGRRQYAAAIPYFERALAMREHSYGPEHANVADTLHDLALTMNSLGQSDEALALHKRALTIRERAFDPDHPKIAGSLRGLASVHNRRAEYGKAALLQERGLAIQERALGPDHPRVADTLNNLGNLRNRQGASDEAIALHKRALAIREKTFGPDHAKVAASLDNLANALQSKGEPDAARVMAERALAIRLETLGPDDPAVGFSLTNLGNAHRRAGESKQAKALYEEALTIFEGSLGKDHLKLVHPLSGLAEVALEAGQTEQAVAFAERVYKLRQTNKVAGEPLASSRFFLGKALSAGGTAPARAVALAEQARDTYRELGKTDALAEVEAWLAAHPQ